MDDHVRVKVAQDYGDSAPSPSDFLVTYACDVRPSRTSNGLSVRGSRVVVGGGTARHQLRPRPAHRERRGGAVPAPAFPLWVDTLGSQFIYHPDRAFDPVKPIAGCLRRPAGPRHRPFESDDELYLMEHPRRRRPLLEARWTRQTAGFAEDEVAPRQASGCPLPPPPGAGEVVYFTLGHCRSPWDMIHPPHGSRHRAQARLMDRPGVPEILRRASPGQPHRPDRPASWRSLRAGLVSLLSLALQLHVTPGGSMAGVARRIQGLARRRVKTQQLLDADTHEVPKILREESPRFLGDADVPIDHYISRSGTSWRRSGCGAGCGSSPAARSTSPTSATTRSTRSPAARTSSCARTETRSRPTPTPACTAAASSSSTTATARDPLPVPRLRLAPRRQPEGRPGGTGTSRTSRRRASTCPRSRSARGTGSCSSTPIRTPSRSRSSSGARRPLRPLEPARPLRAGPRVQGHPGQLEDRPGGVLRGVPRQRHAPADPPVHRRHQQPGRRVGELQPRHHTGGHAEPAARLDARRRDDPALRPRRAPRRGAVHHRSRRARRPARRWPTPRATGGARSSAS